MQFIRFHKGHMRKETFRRREHYSFFSNVHCFAATQNIEMGGSVTCTMVIQVTKRGIL